MRGKNNRRKKKKGAYSESCRNFFTLHLSDKEVWKPCGVDLTFCHQADYVSCRFIPFKPPTQAHDTSQKCIRALHFVFWVYGSVRTGCQGCRQGWTVTAVGGAKDRKMLFKENLTQETDCVPSGCWGWVSAFLFFRGSVLWSHGQCCGHMVIAHGAFLSLCWECIPTSVLLRRLFKTVSWANDASSCETHFLTPPSKNSQIRVLSCNLIAWKQEITDCVTACKEKLLWTGQWWAGASGRGCLLFPPWQLHR